MTAAAPPEPAGTPPPAVRASSPAEILAVVPYLVGFIPQASVVVLGTAPPRGTIRVALRYDLPDPPGDAGAAEIAGHAVTVLTSLGRYDAVRRTYQHLERSLAAIDEEPAPETRDLVSELTMNRASARVLAGSTDH
jgi:hypothetical protein